MSGLTNFCVVSPHILYKSVIIIIIFQLKKKKNILWFFMIILPTVTVCKWVIDNDVCLGVRYIIDDWTIWHLPRKFRFYGDDLISSVATSSCIFTPYLMHHCQKINVSCYTEEKHVKTSFLAYKYQPTNMKWCDIK